MTYTMPASGKLELYYVDSSGVLITMFCILRYYVQIVCRRTLLGALSTENLNSLHTSVISSHLDPGTQFHFPSGTMYHIILFLHDHIISNKTGTFRFILYITDTLRHNLKYMETRNTCGSLFSGA